MYSLDICKQNFLIFAPNAYLTAGNIPNYHSKITLKLNIYLHIKLFS